MKKSAIMVLVIGIISSAFIVYSIIFLAESKPDNEILSPTEETGIKFRELQWDWYGPTSITLGETIQFSVSRMAKFCDEVFDAKIMNQDYSKVLWEDSSEVECVDIKGGKISKASFPVSNPIEIDYPGSYNVIVNSRYYGIGRLTNTLVIEEPGTITVDPGINNTVT